MARCHRPDFVLPDVQDFGHVFELVRLRRRHARREPVQAVLVAVDLLRAWPGLCEHAVLRELEFSGIGFGRRIVPVRAQLRFEAQRRRCEFPGECCLASSNGRLTKLDDVDLRLVLRFGARQLQGHVARVA